MKTLKKVALQLVELDYLPVREDMEFGKFYYSSKYNCSNHLCACGCGEQCPLPIKPTEWTLVVNDGKIEVFPSILQRFECKTHYVITKGFANII